MLVRVIDEVDSELIYIILYRATKPRKYNICTLIQCGIGKHSKTQRIMLESNLIKGIRKLKKQKFWKAKKRYWNYGFYRCKGWK